jgi:multiple sugar transport system ATP-binding protein
MANIEFRDVFKSFGNVDVLKGISFSIKDGDFAVFLGPSGCGKSTALRLISGLETPEKGDIMIGGARVNETHPKDRDIAMVFQDYALYPHLSVAENIVFGLRARNAPQSEVEKMLAATARLAGITALLDRKPAQLSGGQRQRVALARAVARKPKAFLFDEPLSNLDAKLRMSMREELKRLHQQIKTTCVYVTHDQLEAMTLGTQIIIMNGGIIQQIGTPRDLYFRPANRFVAEFIGTVPMNFFPGKLDGEATFAAAGGGHIKLPEPARLDGAASLGVRPEHINLSSRPGYIDSGMKASVELSEFIGGSYIISARCGETLLRLVSEDDIPVGNEVPLHLHERWLYVFGENK